MERPRYAIYNPIKAGYYEALNNHPFQDWMAARGILIRGQSRIAGKSEEYLLQHLHPQSKIFAEYLLSADNRGYLVPSPKLIQTIWGVVFDFVAINANDNWKIDSENQTEFRKKTRTLATDAYQVRQAISNVAFRSYNNATSADVDNFYLRPKETYILYRLYNQLKEGRALKGEEILEPLYKDLSENDRDLSLEANVYICYLRQDMVRANSGITILTEPEGYRLAA